MTGRSTHRIVAMLAAAALAATLVTTALAGDVGAANRQRVVKCKGIVATKVGTAKADVIVGTAKRDVIAGLGGNDIILGRGGNDVICGGAGNDRLVGGGGRDNLLGQTGRDRLFGGTGWDLLFGGLHNDVLAGQAGPDHLFGGAGSDRLDGGVGVDTCRQNTGHGPIVRCELPVPVVPIPVPRTVAIAYSNLDSHPGYGAKDRLIAKLVDVDGNGVDAGDQIVMGYYPLHYWPGPADFEPWQKQSHTVAYIVADERPHSISVRSTGDTYHYWGSALTHDVFTEAGQGAATSSAQDALAGGGQDMILVRPSSPSQPSMGIDDWVDPPFADGDAPFLDVDIYQ